MRLTTFNIWERNLLDFANHENGEVTIKRMPVYGDNYELYSSTIKIQYQNNYISIFQSATKVDYANCGVSSLTLQLLYKSKVQLHIALYEQDFFDKIFSARKIKTGNLKFDKKYTIKASNTEVAMNIFGDKRVQNLFFNNRLLVFNISTNKEETTIKLKYMEDRLYSLEEMTQALSEFRNILDKILR
jgi:hypothetical protein